MTTARWGALLILALLVGGWSGSVVGAPPGGVVAQTTGTSSSGTGGSGASGSGDSGSSGGGDGGGGDAGDGGDTGDGSGGDAGDGSGGDGGDGGDGGEAAPTTAPPDVPEEAIAEGEEADCGDGADPGQRCYEVEQVDGVEAVRVPDGQGGTRVVALGDAPQVNVDSGSSTSASSNVDVLVEVDVDTGDVIRIERRVDPVRQFAVITIAALLGVFVGAAVLGTYLRFRNGPKQS